MTDKTLRDFINPDFELGSWKSDEKLKKHLDDKIVAEYSMCQCDTDEDIREYCNRNPFTQRYVHSWVELESGYAVGFNENPSFGWSYPIKKLKR